MAYLSLMAYTKIIDDVFINRKTLEFLRILDEKSKKFLKDDNIFNFEKMSNLWKIKKEIDENVFSLTIDNKKLKYYLVTDLLESSTIFLELEKLEKTNGSYFIKNNLIKFKTYNKFKGHEELIVTIDKSVSNPKDLLENIIHRFTDAFLFFRQKDNIYTYISNKSFYRKKEDSLREIMQNINTQMRELMLENKKEEKTTKKRKI